MVSESRARKFFYMTFENRLDRNSKIHDGGLMICYEARSQGHDRSLDTTFAVERPADLFLNF